MTEYLEIKGINFNLKELLFGFETLKMGEDFSNEKPKYKIYNAMDIDDESSSGDVVKIVQKTPGKITFETAQFQQVAWLEKRFKRFDHERVHDVEIKVVGILAIHTFVLNFLIVIATDFHGVHPTLNSIVVMTP